MDNKTQCSVVLDLLPLYKEGLLRPDTNESVARHLRECADCRRAYEEMNGSEIPRPSGEAQRQENMKQAEPLRKFRFHFWMNLIGAPLWLPLLMIAFCVVIAVWAALFSALVVLWCAPVSGVALAVAGIPAVIRAAIAGLPQNIIFFAGMMLGCIGLSVLLFCGCAKLSVLFFRGTGRLCKAIGRLFRKMAGKPSKTGGTEK